MNEKEVRAGAVSRGCAKGFTDPQVGGFAAAMGPILQRIEDGQSIAGFVVETRHCNPSGTCHGGWLSTFADVTLARQAHLDLGAGASLRTVSLTVDFLDAARPSEWVEGRARLMRATGTLAFLEGEARVGTRAVLRMNAIFRIRRSPHATAGRSHPQNPLGN